MLVERPKKGWKTSFQSYKDAIDRGTMPKIRVMVNGVPGKMATELAKKLIESKRFEVLPYSLTGQEINIGSFFEVNPIAVYELIKPDAREAFIGKISTQKPDISIDFTHPSAVNANAEFYARHKLNFVMGTTGGDRPKLEQTVVDSGIMAVIAMNMSKAIVAFQAMMKHAADTYPDAFKGYVLEIVESHQQKKADTSGTAKALVANFNALGIPFRVDQIKMIRDPQEQLEMGVPEWALGGHGWHTYTLKSSEDGVLMRFTHNVNGRSVYLPGTIDAVEYLSYKAALAKKGKLLSMIGNMGRAVGIKKKGKVYSMMDVLKGK